MTALHIIVKEGGDGNPPYIRDDEGFGLRLWSHQGQVLGLEKDEDGYLVYLSADELEKCRQALQ
jgi:hypothetical protein